MSQEEANEGVSAETMKTVFESMRAEDKSIDMRTVVLADLIERGMLASEQAGAFYRLMEQYQEMNANLLDDNIDISSQAAAVLLNDPDAIVEIVKGVNELSALNELSADEILLPLESYARLLKHLRFFVTSLERKNYIAALQKQIKDSPIPLEHKDEFLRRLTTAQNQPNDKVFTEHLLFMAQHILSLMKELDVDNRVGTHGAQLFPFLPTSVVITKDKAPDMYNLKKKKEQEARKKKPVRFVILCSDRMPNKKTLAHFANTPEQHERAAIIFKQFFQTEKIPSTLIGTAMGKLLQYNTNMREKLIAASVTGKSVSALHHTVYVDVKKKEDVYINLDTVRAVEAFYMEVLKYQSKYIVLSNRTRKASGYKMYVKPPLKTTAGTVSPVIYNKNVLAWIGAEKWPEDFFDKMAEHVVDIFTSTYEVTKEAASDFYGQARNAVAKLTNRSAAATFLQQGVAFTYTLQGAIHIALYNNLEENIKVGEKTTQLNASPALLTLLRAAPGYTYDAKIPEKGGNKNIIELSKIAAEKKEGDMKEHYLSANKSTTARQVANKNGGGINTKALVVANYVTIAKYGAIPVEYIKGGATVSSWSDNNIMRLLKKSDVDVELVNGINVSRVRNMLLAERDFISQQRKVYTEQKNKYVAERREEMKMAKGGK